MIKKILLGLLTVLVLLGAGGYLYYRLFLYEAPLISEDDRTRIQLMPLPASLEINSGLPDISEGIYLTAGHDAIKDTRVYDFLNRKRDILGLNDNKEGLPLSINVSDAGDHGIVDPIEDEWYALDIEADEIMLAARSTIGAIRGLTTLTQLVQSAQNNTIPAMSLTDIPRYSWRGLMLDVCRHWIPKDVVLRTLDAMEQVKMNVLHLHLSEDQGFRVESKAFPRLHEIGSNGYYYTQEEIREIIAYADDRGIRVVPEFDLPGHSKSWQIAYPELSSLDTPLQFGSKKGYTFTAPVNPAREYTYEFMDVFIGEMASLFPDPYFHIGGDEVNPEAWLSNDSIRMFMDQQSLADAPALQAYFIGRMRELIEKHGKKMIGWEEVFHEGNNKEVVIQSWVNQKSLFEAVRGGTQGILSAGYYLDLIMTAGQHYAVDPAVIPNAVEIRPDSSHWKMFELTIEIADDPRQLDLVLFDRDPGDVYGFMNMLGQMTAFTGGSYRDGQLDFLMDTPYGEMTLNAMVENDSLSGELSVALIGLDVTGHRSGGSDMEGGKPMPAIEYLPPLAEEDKELILGGEACMWAEFVDGNNVESRLWPRAAAIAEKLWSPASLTTDENDMYRRLAFADSIIRAGGVPYLDNRDRILRKICQGECYENLVPLSEIFEEVKYHGRMAGLMELDSLYLPAFPLDRLVDASAPESYIAREFNLRVERWGNDASEKESILADLEKWNRQATNLMPDTAQYEKLGDISNLLKSFVRTSDNALLVLSGKPLTAPADDLEDDLRLLENGENGVIIAIYPGLRKLFSNN